MPAFEHAVGLGYRYIETDVHATADGVLVAFHDSRLDRVTDRTGTIASLPWDVVRQARVAGTEPIPLLEDLLAAWPHVRVNIDAKADASVAPLVEVILRTKAIDRVCVGAFNDRRLGRLRAALGPTLCTALGPAEVARLRFGLAVPRSIPAAQVPVRQGPVTVVNAAFVARAHRLGIAVHVWTIDDERVMTALLDLGVDGIMTDRPAVLKDVLQRRGQWVD
jgi:glycerophosphoryl diester phosphodiesterase